MDESRKLLSKKGQSTQFKKKSGTKKGKRQNSTGVLSIENSHAPETVYRVLCQSIRIGSVIGKGGGRVKALREETQAKITIADPVPGSDERVITILTPSAQIARKSNSDNDDEDPKDHGEDNVMEPLCAAQDALLKVHERIIEEDFDGADKNEVMVTARLLVPNHTVGCLIGRKGDVIQRLRKNTGASIRVLPVENLPRCAFNTDELVQISGKPDLAKKALYEVSTLLHQNPHKDEPPPSFPLASGSHNLHPAGLPDANVFPPGNLPWSTRSHSRYSIPEPWSGKFGNQHSGVGPSEYDSFPLPPGLESPGEFSMKILCSAAKVGGLTGKGGFILRELQQETGARVHIEDYVPESDERVICVSSIEALCNQRSRTIDTILHLQDIISEHIKEGTITTRLLVPSTKVGCILGQGGHIINEMRRRTRADIRVCSKEDKPKCASLGEELVQVSGKFAVAKDALAEVASRLRTRILRDTDAEVEPAPVRPELVTFQNLSERGPSPSGAIRGGSFGRYEGYALGRDEDYECGLRQYEPPGYAIPPSSMSYSKLSGHVRFSSDIADSMKGARGAIMDVIDRGRMRLLDCPPSGSEPLHRCSEHFNLEQSTFRAYGASPGQMNPQRDTYRNYIAESSAYQDINVIEIPYQDFHNHQAPHRRSNLEQASYRNFSAQGTTGPFMVGN